MRPIAIVISAIRTFLSYPLTQHWKVVPWQAILKINDSLQISWLQGRDAWDPDGHTCRFVEFLTKMTPDGSFDYDRSACCRISICHCGQTALTATVSSPLIVAPGSDN